MLSSILQKGRKTILRLARFSSGEDHSWQPQKLSLVRFAAAILLFPMTGQPASVQRDFEDFLHFKNLPDSPAVSPAERKRMFGWTRSTAASPR